MLFKLEKPNLTKLKEEDFSKAFSEDIKDETLVFAKKCSTPEYLYWDKVKYKEPAPKGISKEMLWMVIVYLRESQSLKSPIKDKNGHFFKWSKLDYFEEFFHNLDMDTGGEIFSGKGEIDKTNKQKLITRGIMEEAIASSQLEGAATSRQAAKKMLREGRKPINSSEQMIVNSYLSMRAIEDDYKDKKLSKELLLEMHSLITKDTVDSHGDTPRIRDGNETVYVGNNYSGIDYYEAPDIQFVNTELERLIKFANDDFENETFIHPVVKAIMLHFWIGYLHPFTDGNGRLARLIFYWYLVKKNYWAFAYLPVSKAIKKSPKQYAMAYVYTEQGGNDLTYFLDYNIRKIKLAVKDFLDYIDKQSNGNIQMKQKCDEKYKLNIRQVQLLQYLYGDPDSRTTLKTHMNVNQISKMTAYNDLKDLIKKGFLISNKRGRNVFYVGSDKIKELF